MLSVLRLSHFAWFITEKLVMLPMLMMPQESKAVFLRPLD